VPVAVALIVVGCSSAPPPEVPPTRVALANAEGVRRLESGDPRGAEEAFLRALSVAELEDDLDGQADAWNGLGVLARERGAAAEAVALHRRALGLHGQAGSTEPEARTRMNLGTALLDLGKNDDARAQFEAAATAWDKLDRPREAARATTGTASAKVRAGDRSGLELARASEATARKLGDEPGLASALAVESAALELQSDLPGARAALDEALALDRKHEAPHATLADLLALARVAEKQKDLAAAGAFLARAARIEKRLGQIDACARDLSRAAQLLEGGGKKPEAQEVRAELEAVEAARRSSDKK
jgi:tetratricopeptide (TPR) repeat protein